MNQTSPVHPADLLGFSRLAIDGTLRLTDLIEAMHEAITGSRWTTGGISTLVYENIRKITGLVGGGLAGVLDPLVPLAGEIRSTPKREAALAALNGVIGDYLAATDNPLAIAMRLRRKGRPLTIEKPALAASIPCPSRKLMVLVHGLCMNDRQWTRRRHNHGAALTRDLGYTGVHLHYNSGLHVSTNGRAFAGLLEDLVRHWPTPLEEFAIITHSLGGLVARSAYHYGAAAGHRWPGRLGTLIFLGTPHHGVPLERIGNCVDRLLQANPYTSPLARLGKIRSAGITDLRYGNLLDEDWQGRDRFDHCGDPRCPVPLPRNVRCYAIAATGATEGTDMDCLPGDRLVPVHSALGHHEDSGRSLSFTDQWIGHGMGHWDLLNRPRVYEQLARWLA